MSSDDEVCGNSFVCPRSGRTPTSAGKRKRPERDRGVSGAADEVEELGDDLCYLCAQTLDGDDHDWRNKLFHRKCVNAIRCYRRMATSAGTIQNADALFFADPAKWRAQVSPLIRTSAGSRTSSIRAQVKQHIVEQETYNDKQRVATTIIMSRRRFRKHRRDTEDMGSLSADSEFEKRLKRQNRRYCTKDEDKVGVSDDERETITNGTRSSKKTQDATQTRTSHDDEPNEDGEARREGRSRSSAGGRSHGQSERSREARHGGARVAASGSRSMTDAMSSPPRDRLARPGASKRPGSCAFSEEPTSVSKRKMGVDRSMGEEDDDDDGMASSSDAGGSDCCS